MASSEASFAIGSDAWAWILVGGLCLGIGLGLLIRAFVAGTRDRRRASARRSTLAFVLLALGTLAAAGLFIFPDKASLGDSRLVVFGLGFTGAGILVGLLPRAVGIPLLMLATILASLVAAGLDGWVRADRVREIAVLTPFVVDEKGVRGELAVEEKDTVPIIQKIDIPTVDSGLVIERLELSGPLALLGGNSFYRVAGLAGKGEVLAASFVLRFGLLDLVLPLGPAIDAVASLPFVIRWRETIRAPGLTPMVPLRFRLDPAAGRGKGLSLALPPTAW
jgi:hypothetical protein